jgi:hypothetical protein
VPEARRDFVGTLAAKSRQEEIVKRNIFAPVLSVLLLGGTAAVAQDTSMEKTDQKKVTTTEGTMKSKDHTVVGTVKEYEAGKKIEVLVGKKTRSFALDSKSVSATVDPAVAVGSKVKVVESESADGMKTLTVNPAS